MLNVLTATIKYNHIYTCSKCGKREIGDTNTKTVYAYSAEELKRLVEDFPLTSHAMPIGWSFNGEFFCKRCK